MHLDKAVLRVYISHGPRDKDLARDMARRVRLAGFQPIVEVESVPRPERRRALRERVRSCNAVLMLVTPSAVETGEIIWDLGLAEALDKVVVPITVGLEAHQLPEPLQTYQALPYDRLDEAIAGLSDRLANSV